MAAPLSASLRGSRPNFVLFNVDDTGFGDWSWNLHGAAKHAASDGGVDTPHTAALVRAPTGMPARAAAHRPSPLRLVARRIGSPCHPPCHPTLPPRTARLAPTDAAPTPLSLLGAAGARPAADRLPRGLLGVHALPRRAHDRQARAAHRLTLSLTLTLTLTLTRTLALSRNISPRSPLHLPFISPRLGLRTGVSANFNPYSLGGLPLAEAWGDIARYRGDIGEM